MDEAIIRAFDFNFLPYFKKIDIQEFRTKVLYNKEADALLRKHAPTLQDIYRKVARIDSGLGGYMNISEFTNLVLALGLVDEKNL
jgi:hypothetical protein